MWFPRDRRGADFAHGGRTKKLLFLGALAAALCSRTTSGDTTANKNIETITVVTPRPTHEPLEDGAASASVITADRTPRSAESLPQLLSDLPGVSITRFGALGALSTISLRGSSPNQVQVYVDGVPLGTSSGDGVDLGLIPVADCEHIEVYRGSSPLAFPSSAIGGVVSLRSQMPRASGVSADAGSGSFGTHFGGGRVAWAGSQFQTLGSLHFLRSAGDFSYRDDNGTVFNTSDDSNRRRQNNAIAQIDGLVRASYAPSAARRFFLTSSFLDRDQGVAALARLQSYEAALRTRRLLGSLAYDARGDLGTGSRVHARAYTVLAEQRFRDELGEIVFVPTRTRDRTVTLGATVLASRPLGPQARLSALADGRREVFAPHDDLAADPNGPPGTRTFAAVGVEANAWTSGMAAELVPSVRMEMAHDQLSHAASNLPSRANAGSTYVLPIFRLGVIARPGSSTKLRANAGRYARLPSMMERYGNTGRIVGNPDLVPEKGLNADLGATWTVTPGARTSLTIDGAVFGALVDDLITYQKGAYQMRARNVGKVRILGAELSLEATAWHYARLLAQGTFTDARDASGVSASDGKQLPHRPRLRAHARPEARGLPLGKRRRWECGFYGDADVTGGNYLDPNNLVSLSTRVLLGAGAYVESKDLGTRLVVSAENLSDSRVNDVADFPLPGRSIFFSLRWSSEFEKPITTHE